MVSPLLGKGFKLSRVFSYSIADLLSFSNDYCADKIIDVLHNESGYEFNSKLKAPIHNNKSIQTEQVFFKDIIGLDNALVEVTEVVQCLKNPEKYIAIGAQLPKGILLEGSPGCGKTMIAKAIANESGCAFFYATASDFVEMYVGLGASRIRELFAKARVAQPAIIFIDEIDAIGAVNRGAGGNEEYRQTLNALLTELDGFQASGKIVVIAATNFAKALDSALVRAGRFDRLISIGMPNEQARFDLLKHYICKLPSVSYDVNDQFLHTMAQLSEDLSPADIKVLVNDAPMIALRSDSQEVSKKHLTLALERVVQSRKKNKNKFNKDLF